MAFNESDTLSTTDNTEITADIDINVDQRKKQPEMTQEQARQFFAHEVKDRANQLKSHALIKELPEPLREAFNAKSIDLELLLKNDTLEPLKAVADIDSLTDTVFKDFSRRQGKKINDETLAQISTLPIVAETKTHGGNVFSRNWLSLSLMATATLIGVGLVLLASGMFAPLGIILSGASFIATLAAAVSAAVLILGLGVKIVGDEWKNLQQLHSEISLSNQYKQQSTNDESNITDFNNSVAHYRKLVAQHHQKYLCNVALSNQQFSQDEEFFSCDEGSDSDEDNTLDNGCSPSEIKSTPRWLLLLDQELNKAEAHLHDADTIDVMLATPEHESHNREHLECNARKPEMR